MNTKLATSLFLVFTICLVLMGVAIEALNIEVMDFMQQTSQLYIRTCLNVQGEPIYDPRTHLLSCEITNK